MRLLAIILGIERTAAMSSDIGKEIDIPNTARVELDLHDTDYKDSYLARKLMDWIEQYWFMENKIPSIESAVEKGIDRDLYETWISSKPFREDLAKRGLPITVSGGDSFVTLTDRQMLAVELITDLIDNRSIKVKLAEAGIESKEWVRWLADPSFASYINSKTEMQLKSHQHEANLALMDKVRESDVSAIKYYNEMMGRFSTSKAAIGSIDPGWLIQHVIEILQEETKVVLIHDPDLMKRIADKLMGLIIRVAAEQVTGR